MKGKFQVSRASDSKSFAVKLAEFRTHLEMQTVELLEEGRGEEAKLMAAKLEALREISNMAPEKLYKAYLDVMFPPLR